MRILLEEAWFRFESSVLGKLSGVIVNLSFYNSLRPILYDPYSFLRWTKKNEIIISTIFELFIITPTTSQFHTLFLLNKHYHTHYFLPLSQIYY